MVDAGEIWKLDPMLRIAGIALVATCWFLMRWLVHSANLHARHDPSLLDFGAAATGFLCVSVGSALTALGAHVFDEVEVSERWARRCDVGPARDGAGITPACRALLDLEIAAARGDRVTDRADPLSPDYAGATPLAARPGRTSISAA